MTAVFPKSIYEFDYFSSVICFSVYHCCLTFLAISGGHIAYFVVFSGKYPCVFSHNKFFIGLCYFITLGVPMLTWLRSQWKWRLRITIITMYGECQSYMYFQFPDFVVYISKYLHWGYYIHSTQLAFFTTRKVNALEELTWVSWFPFSDYFDSKGRNIIIE